MKRGINLTIFDLKSKQVESIKSFTFPKGYCSDDHNSPGLCIAPNGNYVASWSHHQDRYCTRYSIYNGKRWSTERFFDWKSIPGGTNFTVCYSNLYSLEKENRIYNFVRSNNRAPNLIYSEDNGETWKFGGQITTNNQRGYTKGYYKFCSNNSDRIDIVLNEKHPREGTKGEGTNLYHGYIKDRKIHDSYGNIISSNIHDGKCIPTDKDFTRIFKNGTTIRGIPMYRCWQHDILRYNDGTVAVLFKVRAYDDQMDHRHFYAQFKSNKWKTFYLGKAGPKLYNFEEDYTGLGSLCPYDPNRFYISTPFHPANDHSIPQRYEIWRGSLKKNNIIWKAITANSSMDNIRPVSPKWDRSKVALLWLRGIYKTYQDTDTKLVGIFCD